ALTVTRRCRVADRVRGERDAVIARLDRRRLRRIDGEVLRPDAIRLVLAAAAIAAHAAIVQQPLLELFVRESGTSGRRSRWRSGRRVGTGRDQERRGQRQTPTYQHRYAHSCL